VLRRLIDKHCSGAGDDEVGKTVSGNDVGGAS
jgi:hypothetical protein